MSDWSLGCLHNTSLLRVHVIHAVHLKGLGIFDTGVILVAAERD